MQKIKKITLQSSYLIETDGHLPDGVIYVNHCHEHDEEAAESRQFSKDCKSVLCQINHVAYPGFKVVALKNLCKGQYLDVQYV